MNDNSERTPMKEHPVELKENLKTNEGVERVSFDEVKVEMVAEFKEGEERRSQSSAFSSKFTYGNQSGKKKDAYHDIKNFENVINHKNKYALENNRVEE